MKNSFLNFLSMHTGDPSGETETVVVAKENLCKQLRELTIRLQKKEAEMKIFQSFDPVYLRLQYERKLEELEEEKQSLQVNFCISFGKESLGWLHVTTVLSTTHFVSSMIVSLFSQAVLL
jgi:hypothetical protein